MYVVYIIKLHNYIHAHHECKHSSYLTILQFMNKPLNCPQVQYLVCTLHSHMHSLPSAVLSSTSTYRRMQHGVGLSRVSLGDATPSFSLK